MNSKLSSKNVCARTMFSPLVQLANFKNVTVGEFRRYLIFTLALTTLRIPIGSIVGVGPKEQMRRIAARSRIASVTNEQSFWHSSIRKLKRCAMCVSEFLRKGCHSVTSNAPLCGFGFCASPRPAGIRTTGLVNFVPELFRGLFFSGHNEKTSTNPEVKSAKCGGNGIGRCESMVSLFLGPLQGQRCFSMGV